MAGTIHVLEKRGPLGGMTVKGRYDAALVPNEPLWFYVPQKYREMEVVLVKHNGVPVNDDDLMTIRPHDGDTISLMPVAGAVSALIGAGISLVIGVALRIGEYHWNKYNKARRKDAERRARVGDSYALDVMENSYEDGARVPVVMGTHRAGGIVISEFTDSIEEGKDRVNRLVAVSEGPIEDITSVYIDGNPIANYNGASFVMRLGTNTHTVVPGFGDTVATASMSSQLLEGATVTVNGTIPCDRWSLKVYFADGLYVEEHDGSFGSLSWHSAVQYRTSVGPGAWGPAIGVDCSYRRRRLTPFSVWFTGTFPTPNTQYDIRITRMCGNSQGRYHYDAYLKEFNEKADDGLIYPNTALLAVKAAGSDQLTGSLTRVTGLVEGIRVHTMASATTFAVDAHTDKPAELILGLLYNHRWGLGKEIDTRIECTMTATALDFSAGEDIDGDTAYYPFKGVVESWDGATRKLVVRSLQGLPYGTLTGATSGKVAVVSSVDELYAVDLASLWALRQWNATQVYDRKDATFVNANSPSGGDKIYVPSTTGWAAPETVCIGFNTAREEVLTVSGVGSDGTGPYIQTTTNLGYTHTPAQADSVIHADNTEDQHTFNYVWDGAEDGWAALERIAKCAQAAVARIDGNYIYLVPLKAETPVQLVNMGNVLSMNSGPSRQSTFKMEFPDTRNPANKMTADYLDADEDYKKRPATVEIQEAYDNGESINVRQIEMYGVTSRRQVEDILWYRLKRLRYGGEPIQFEMGLENIDFIVGDCIYVQHDLPGIGTGGGRVVSSTNSTVTLDHPVTIAGGETIRIRHADDSQETAVVTSAAGTHKTLSIAAATWTANPAANDLWAVGDLGTYRVVSIKLTRELRAVVQCEEEADGLYDGNPYTVPEFTATTLPDPDEMPPDVENLTLTDGVQEAVGHGVIPIIDVHWTRPEHPSYSHAEVWMADLSNGQVMAGKTGWAPGNGTSPVEFRRPRGLASSGQYLYVADSENNRILKLDRYDLTYEAVSTFAFNYPSDLCTDGTYVYVVDADHRIITLACADLSHVNTFGSYGTGNGEFNYPYGICTDDGSNLWVADTMNYRVQRFAPAVGVPVYAAQVGSQGTGNANFNRPMGIDYASNYIYIADAANHRIKKHDSAGAMAYSAEVGSYGTGDSNFKWPSDVAVESDGSAVFVADYQNHVVKHFNGSFVHQATWGTTGTAGPGPDLFNLPRGLCRIADALFVAEYGNCRVQLRDDDDTLGEDWTLVGRSTDLWYRIASGITTGKKIRIAVRSVSPHNVCKHPEDAPYDDITPTGTASTPPDVANIYCAMAGTRIRLWWDQVIHPNLAGYEIRAGTDWDTGRVLVREHTATEVQVDPPGVGGQPTFMVKAKSRCNVYSDTEASVMLPVRLGMTQLMSLQMAGSTNSQLQC